ncbi:MAG TPA: dienelactone hydrolase family protein [Terriglobales bacterium]|nr:dienelactone hydrolase family protein [Terriglobales bacterium]
MIEDAVEIRTQDGVADSFFYHDGKRRPGVLFLTDIFGIREANRDMAQRLAEAGYAVLMPNIFYRAGKPPLFQSKPNFDDEQGRKRLAELSGPLTAEATQRDASAYVQFLKQNQFVRRGHIGVVGYCFTGAMALRTAAAFPGQIAAAASFHGGRLFVDGPNSPHHLLPEVEARLYFGHAADDRSMPADAIERLNEALKRWGGKYESETYDGAHHGWTVPDSAAYNHPQAERAFEKLKELFFATLT